MTKRIVLCADDYGQAPTISAGIIALINANRLSATSCMVNSIWWPEHGQWLASLQSKIDIGLHFNLTEGRALSPEFIKVYGHDLFPLTTLMRRAFLRKLDKDAIAAECHAQLASFEVVTGFLPRFVDGHQHIHQFPIIRDALFEVYEQRLSGSGAYIRLVNETIYLKNVARDLKKIIIYASGTRQLKGLLEKYKIPHNHSFAGIYTFNKSQHYAELFPRFLEEIKDHGLIMCHPGLASSSESDVIAAARFAEYQYFAGGQFLSDCEAKNVTLERLT